jgi:dolichol-phosphate mannosyltransferase
MTERSGETTRRAAVIVPTYNERDNIGPLVEALVALPVVDRVIVVDDASPDGTGAIADELAQRHPQLEVIHRAGKLGLGTAYVAGIQRALTRPVDGVLTMDADFSHHPRYIPALVAESGDHDLVIGSRYVPGGGTLNWGPGRRCLSWTANFVARSALGLSAGDCTAGFRCYQRELIARIDLDAIRSNGYSFLVEMLYRCQQAGCRVGEVPILFENRRLGASKISRGEIVKAVMTVLRLSLERMRSATRG